MGQRFCSFSPYFNTFWHVITTELATPISELKPLFAAPADFFKGSYPPGFDFRVPGNDILALDEVQTVLYTHMVITRFLYRSAGLNERQSLPKKAKVAAI